MRRLAVLCCIALTGAAPPQPELPPGEGVVCMMALVNVAAQIGRQCFAGQNAAQLADLDRIVGRFDAYVLKNSTMTAEQIAKFKRDQASVGLLDPKMCHGDALSIYQGFSELRSADLEAQTDKLLARAGTPTWGDCL